MTDLSLNPQLGARLKALQLAWGHDSPSETASIIFDAIIYKWSINLPSNADIRVDTAVKVRLRNRHQAYFSQMSQLTGCSVPELARSSLIQWICFPSQPQSSQHSTQMLPETPQVSPKTTRMLPSKTKKTAKKPQVEVIAPQPRQETPKVDEKQTAKEEKSTTTGRTALSGLLKK